MPGMRRCFHASFPFNPSKFPFFYGWWILFASSIGVVASIPGQTMGFSVFTPILSETLGLGASMISSAYLVGTVTSGLLLPQVGKWFDRLGSRVLGTIACAVMGAGLIYLSQVDRITSIFTRGIPIVPPSWIAFIAIAIGFFWLRFTGQGTLTMTARSMLGKWFHYKRGLALSISGIVVSFSFSVAPKVLDLGIHAIGWRSVWLLLGIGSMTFMALFVWLFFRDNPEECGLHMDGNSVVNAPANTHEDLQLHRDFTRNEAMRTTAFWVFNLTIGLHAFVITGYTFHVVSIAEDLGLETSVLLQAFVPASIIGIGISLLGGWASARTRLKYLLAFLPFGGFIFSIGPAAQLGFTSSFVIIGLGLSGGMFGIISGTVWPRFFGRKHLGAISGVNMATMVYSSAAAPLCFSLTREWFGNYRPMFGLMSAMYLTAFACAFIADNPQRELNPNQG